MKYRGSQMQQLLLLLLLAAAAFLAPLILSITFVLLLQLPPFRNEYNPGSQAGAPPQYHSPVPGSMYSRLYHR